MSTDSAFGTSITLNDNPRDPLIRTFLRYCLPTLKEKYADRLLSEIPEHHKKAIIACHLGAHMVYKRGLSWFPTVVDILPLILETEEEWSADTLEMIAEVAHGFALTTQDDPFQVSDPAPLDA